ncbi:MULTISPECIES: flavodoxin family protein [unclassified Photobacterium]|uniref:flavodoxin family protein n=1 Tax=unclassified Photobacterium TaxID=2628852 RepID=UPI001EDFEE29|nr:MULTISPECIES: flavodoxin family protein [unclassified Photobacterium]MCG3862620.1 NAD(P)H-dependent oxidoreductase [Photobacterium sp. Ph6]MCG3874151.1 NAD(P)H-dependent oxidoreductase [Photobacterium sp. Ph5]
MKAIAIVYFSQTDVTGALVDACCHELELEPVEMITHKITGSEIVEGRFVNHDLMAKLQCCQAIIFASPTYMGSVSAQFKAFADATSDIWCDQKLAGKIAAGITSGGSPNGDQTETLRYFQILASQHGMIWVGIDKTSNYSSLGVNRLGCQTGVVATSEGGKPYANDIATAKYLARRIYQFIQ